MLQIFCLMMSGRPLTDEAASFLLKAACQMASETKDRKEIKSENIEGFIFTDFKKATIGAISGIVFSAEVATERGETFVTYIVRTQDITF